MHIPFLNKKLSPKHNQNKTLRSGRVYIHKEKIYLRKIAKQYESCDFSHCDLSNYDNIYWLQSKKFYKCSFCAVSFGAMADHGNLFDNCLFEYVDFRKSILGYDAARYIGCTFSHVKFRSFIKAYFYECKFIDCYFDNVDFNASYFEKCDFVGVIDGAWFRGGFPTMEDTKEYGQAQQNLMKNVSFANAELHQVHFSDNCDLSSITLPQKGHYLFFDDWDKQLEEIKRNATGEEKQVIKEEIEEFTGIHKIYSESQKCYIINVEDLNQSYCKLSVKIIIRNATLEINDGTFI